MNSPSFPLEESGARYSAWLAKLTKHDLLPRERLLPVLEASTPITLPALMAGGRTEDAARLGREAAALGPWGYSIHLADGVLTGHPSHLERFLFRAHLIGNAVREAAGGDLGGASVLDMACNHGYFALHFANEGATAKGVDLREENIRKADFLRRHFGVGAASFAVQNVYETEGKFDVVLNLGLLYHVTDPYSLVKKTYDLCRRFAVIDTITHRSPVSAFVQRTNKNVAHHAEGQFSVEYHPTYRALIDLMQAVGFKSVVEVVPREEAGRAINPLYERMERRCLIGFR